MTTRIRVPTYVPGPEFSPLRGRPKRYAVQ